MINCVDTCTHKHMLMHTYTYAHTYTLLTQDEDTTVPVSFICLYQRAKKKGDVLLGYVDADGAVKLNPDGKAEPNITLLSVESFVTISCDLM